MRAIPMTERVRILDFYRAGKSTREIAELVGYCVAAVRRVRQQDTDCDEILDLAPRLGRKTLLTPARENRLRNLVRVNPYATLVELGANMDRPFAASTVDGWLRKLNITLKMSAHKRPWPHS